MHMSTLAVCRIFNKGLRTSSERAAAADVLARATLLSMSATVSTDDTVPFSAVVKLSSPLRLRCAGAAP
jgi:hypothetical protein